MRSTDSWKYWPGRRSMSAGISIAFLTLMGCNSTLETGYVPRPLGTSSTERRGYYASPFTPEAAAAAQASGDPTADIRNNRKPGGGYRGP
ncbi:hypothetical protein [Humisphaera borealis]|uniref:Uncharacterized protein n=1 Tax=Humisphaera borealis TaxID=2807512 RepID=A0A7M2X1N5_9BACT|nr:hypothetical protein [Humisphaera borealis]QOV91574.1 hypothetical protein IPV69_09525 [Humisphaera borealis]